MPKLTYWVAPALRDRRAYSIRERTKKACTAERDKRIASDLAEGMSPRDYGEPEKVVVEYRDAFDLVCQALGDGGIEPW